MATIGLITTAMTSVCMSVALSACLPADFGGGDGDGSDCAPHFSDGAPCELDCDASSTVIMNGNPYCTTTCGPFGECPSGHVCAQFSAGAVPPSICLPPCDTGADCDPRFLGVCTQRVCGL